jgi:hypothetical protein
MSGFNQTWPLFQASRIVSGGVGQGFLILQKCQGFWPMSIVTLNFSVFVMYVIVCSSQATFQL